MSLRWSSYVAPKSPKGGLKNEKRPRFPSKISFRLKKVCHKVSFCENCQQHRYKAFIGLSIHAKIIGGGHPFAPEILGQTDPVGAKSTIPMYFARRASALTPSEKKFQLTLIELN